MFASYPICINYMQYIIFGIITIILVSNHTIQYITLIPLTVNLLTILIGNNIWSIINTRLLTILMCMLYVYDRTDNFYYIM